MKALPQFEERKGIIRKRLLRGLCGNFNISDKTLTDLVDVAFESGVQAGISKCYELQRDGKDVREALK